jgi:XRE family transcriptional regulator, regulator of sulfur utilization
MESCGVPTKTILQTLGDEVRKRRKGRHWSQEKLALEVGVHTNAIGRLERGETDSKVLTLFDIAMGLETPLADLIAGVERREHEWKGDDNRAERLI